MNGVTRILNAIEQGDAKENLLQVAFFVDRGGSRAFRQGRIAGLETVAQTSCRDGWTQRDYRQQEDKTVSVGE